MKDINLSTRNTRIFVSSSLETLYPATNIYPSPDLYPVEVGEEITTIVAGSMSLEEILIDDDLIFGQLNATKFEVQLYNVDDLSNKFIVVSQTDDSGSIKMIFSGIIDSSTKNRDGLDRTIVAYDRAYYYGNQNVATWWATFWASRTEATIAQIRQSLLAQMGISYVDVSLPNDSLTVGKNVDFNVLTFSAILKMLCEINCCFPHFNRSGELEFIVLDDEAEPIDIVDAIEGDSSTFEDFITEPITGIQFLDSSGAIKKTVGGTDNIYVVSQDNVFLYALNDAELETVGNNMLSYISEVVYNPCTVKMIAGDLDYTLGKKMKALNSDSGEVIFYILQNSYSNAQLIDQTIRVPGKQHLDADARALETSATMLNEKYSRLTFDLTQFSVELGNFETATATRFTQTDEKIETEVQGAIKFLESELNTNYTGDYVPTTSNSPANEWSTLLDKASHVNDTFYYNNSSTGESKIYCWRLISGTTYGWVDVTSAYQASVSSAIQQLKDQITLQVEKQADYTGAVAPTTSNYPASSWTTDALKKAHLNEVYQDKETGKFYVWRYTDGIKLKFSDLSATEGVSFDYASIYYYQNGNYYQVKNPNSKNTSYPYRFGSNGDNNDIAGTEVYLPVANFYLHWHTDGSVTNWGFEIASIAQAGKTGAFSSATANLPRSVDSTVIGVSNALSTVKTAHQYANSADYLWEVQTGLTIGAYAWEEVGDSITAVQSALIDINLESITLSIDNHGTSSTLTLKAGEATLASENINITGFVTFSNLSTSGQTTINGDNITTGTIKSTNGNMTIAMDTGAITAKQFSLSSTYLSITDNGYMQSGIHYVNGSPQSDIDVDDILWLDGTTIEQSGETTVLKDGIIKVNYYDSYYNGSRYTRNNNRYIQIDSGKITFYSEYKTNAYSSIIEPRNIDSGGTSTKNLQIVTNYLYVNRTENATGDGYIRCKNIGASYGSFNDGEFYGFFSGRVSDLHAYDPVDGHGDEYGYSGWFTSVTGSGNGVRHKGGYCDMRWSYGLLMEISPW